jgi:hypothetical protein
MYDVILICKNKKSFTNKNGEKIFYFVYDAFCASLNRVIKINSSSDIPFEFGDVCKVDCQLREDGKYRFKFVRGE